MARSRRPWFDAALASSSRAARSPTPLAAGVRRETVSRAMRDPESAFAKELAQLRSAAASSATAPGALVEKATAVLEQQLASGDAKAALDPW